MSNYSGLDIIELAAVVAENLQNHGVDVVLVGGLAVEIYTENLYLTKDIDMVNTNYSTIDTLHNAMAGLGFYKQGRVYVNDTTDITVEFPPGPLSVGDTLIKKITHQQVANKRIPILTLEDVIKDRLAAYVHWQDRQSLIQATTLMIKHRLNPKVFKAFCLKEGSQTDYKFLLQLHKQASKQEITSMYQLESILAELLLKNI